MKGEVAFTINGSLTIKVPFEDTLPVADLVKLLDDTHKLLKVIDKEMNGKARVQWNVTHIHFQPPHSKEQSLMPLEALP